MINLSGKVALITGGSRGIGKSIVRLFHDAGAHIVFTYRNSQTEAESLCAELRKKSKSEVFALHADFGIKGDVQSLVENTIENLGTIEILVHNAGIWTEGAIDTMGENTWIETIQTNLNSAYYLCREISPVMKKQRSGRIIFISSTAGQRGEAYHSHYAASKGGIISLTKSLADELGPFGIRTNAVAPGWVRTDMTGEVFADKAFLKKIEQNIPLRYVPQPEEIAGPVLFLASDLAMHINGEILNVNGGSVLCG
jgi:3-oxoacyl-[acyl-carrier protein] reductase